MFSRIGKSTVSQYLVFSQAQAKNKLEYISNINSQEDDPEDDEANEFMSDN